MHNAKQSPIVNAFTVDVEDYFQVSAFEHLFPRSTWDQQSRRVELSTQNLLETLARHQVVGTFFTLGWVAERTPQLIRQIVTAGHELASHGYDHTRVTELTPQAFREDVAKTKKILEDIAGVEVSGYRAPTFSFRKNYDWAYDILAETGHRYSSSIAPLKHDLYGVPDAPRHFYRASAGLTEIPLSTVRLGGRNYPCGGGGFFRLYPYRVTKWCTEHINTREGKPCIFYMHPWEFDPEQPRQTGLRLKTRVRHYLNLHRVQHRLERLLADFAWGRMDRIFLS
jgi:polysaccharide deacetylase family protein (PEP-CTERM system associated)